MFDLQWHFFADVVMLMAAYTLQRDEHVGSISWHPDGANGERRG